MYPEFEGLRERQKELLQLLNDRTMYFSEIVEHEAINFGKPTVSKHLSELQESGLVTSERVGQKKFYSTTERWEDLKDQMQVLNTLADRWVRACAEQVEQYDQGELSTDEFMQQTFGTLVPLFPMRIWGVAYTQAFGLGAQDFFDEPDRDLDRKQEELLKHAYEVCRKYEIKGVEKLQEIDYDSMDEELSDYFNLPGSAILDPGQIRLFSD